MSTKNIGAEAEGKHAVSRLLPKKISLALLQEIFELGLICFTCYGLLKWLPRGYFLDGNIRLQAILNLFQHGTITKIDYSYIGPVFSFPLFLIDKFNNSYRWWLERYNVVLCITVFIVGYVLLRKKMNANILR